MRGSVICRSCRGFPGGSWDLTLPACACDTRFVTRMVMAIRFSKMFRATFIDRIVS